MRIDDLVANQRWSHYREEALQSTLSGRSCHFRYSAMHSTMFRQEAGVAFATHAALAWNSLGAMTNSAVRLRAATFIGQAKGMLIERIGIDAVDAFDLRPSRN